ncbi:MAG: DegT/DnrJ/EryC1/StrS aminotransferase family protein, partial [Olsenella sp.]|nr:DegT/DnrJ/EryC1/StrS aminotransferase family protein [Olsenella sp.]
MTVKTDVTAPLREAFAQRTDTSPDDWFCTFKARYGMREAFSAVRDVAGDGRVLTTLFTGCTAVDSILAAGMGVGYAAIDGATLSVDAALLEVGPEVRAVLLQNSYGMVDEAVTRTIADKAHAAGAILVEDSAHCLSRMARDADGRPVADVSIHSFGIEKTFSDIYFGGALWVNPAMADAALHD